MGFLNFYSFRFCPFHEAEKLLGKPANTLADVRNYRTSPNLHIRTQLIVILYLFVEHRLLPPDPRQDLCDQYRQQCNQDTECYRHL